MKLRHFGALCVVAVALGIVVYKQRAMRPSTDQESGKLSPSNPSVVLVADFREAGTADNCAKIIGLVRAARDRGLAVREFTPDDKSELLKRYRVLVVPTVLVLDSGGGVLARFEGEESNIVEAIRTKLDALTKVRH